MSLNDKNMQACHRVPTCALCRVHGSVAVLKGHKRICPWKTCGCSKCELVARKRRIMARLIQLRREQLKEDASKAKQRPILKQKKKEEKEHLEVRGVDSDSLLVMPPFIRYWHRTPTCPFFRVQCDIKRVTEQAAFACPIRENEPTVAPCLKLSPKPLPPLLGLANQTRAIYYGTEPFPQIINSFQ